MDALPKRKAKFIEPMECALVSTLPEGPDWTFEIKLDSYRAIGVKSGARNDSLLAEPKELQQAIPANRQGAR
jgi:bifunctional non-homologous end joining protein LigD